MGKATKIALAIGFWTLATSAQGQFASRAPAAKFDSAALSLPPAGCGSKDDGSTENALGLTAGGEMGWIKVVNCGLDTYDSVATAYGTLMFPGSVTNGAVSRIAVYTAAGVNPGADAHTVKTIIVTAVTNGDTDIVNKIPLGVSRTTTGIKWVMATADQVAGQFPGPMDQNSANPDAWVVGSTLGPGTMNLNTLTSNNVAPLNMGAIGFPSTWLLRLENTGGGPTEPGTELCHGVNCPCGNNSTSGGCTNGAPLNKQMTTVKSTVPGNILPDQVILTFAPNTIMITTVSLLVDNGDGPAPTTILINLNTITATWAVKLTTGMKLTVSFSSDVAVTGTAGTWKNTTSGATRDIPTANLTVTGGPMQGARLSASGSNSIAADDLVLTADFTTNQPGLFFQGDVTINGGNGVAFGDGLRCCGTNVIRLEVADPSGTNGPHTISTKQAIIGTSPPGTIQPGVKQCYQWWYRNPNRSLCGANFNLSNAYTITWTP